MNYSMFFVINGVDVSVIGKKKSDQWYVSGDNCKVQRCEAIFISGFDQIRSGHHQNVSRLSGTQIIARAAVMQGSLSSSIPLQVFVWLKRCVFVLVNKATRSNRLKLKDSSCWI